MRVKALTAIALAAVLALLTIGGAAADVAAPKDTIRVLAAGHRIDYPDKLVFNLQAEGDATITEVRLFYSVGGRPAQVYGYPDFEPGLRVSTDFSVQTSGSSFIPTGVEIEYYYQITDVNGNTVETTPWSFEFRDPRYRWNSLTIGSLTVLSHDISERRVRQAASDVAARIEEIKPVFGIEDVHTMKAVVVNSSREARRSFPFLSEASKRGHYFAGFAFEEYDLFIMQGLDTDTMIHEATHLLVHQAADSPLARVPAWLNEGLAMQFEDRSIVRSATIRSAARAGRLLSLKNMGTVPGRSRDISLFYAQAWSVVDYMVDNSGPERIPALLAELNSRAADRRGARHRVRAVGGRAGRGVACRPAGTHAHRSQARSRHDRHGHAAVRCGCGRGGSVGVAMDMAVAARPRAVGLGHARPGGMGQVFAGYRQVALPQAGSPHPFDRLRAGSILPPWEALA